MTSATSFASGLLRRGPRLLGGLVAAVVLMPLPAMALTFTSPWTATYMQSGAPIPTKPTFSDAVSGQRDDLTVDMGTYQGATKTATSTINLTRGFSVTNGSGQNVLAEADYSTYLTYAGFNTGEQVKDSKGHVIMDLSGGIFNVNNPSGTQKLYANSGSTTVNIGPGNYTITVSLTYTTNNKIGSWKMKSKHHYEAMGL